MQQRRRTYPSDTTDAQWARIAAFLPTPGHPSANRGRPAKWPQRNLVDAILYLVRTGCAWRQLPADYPPWRTVYGYFQRWSADGTLDQLHDALRLQVRARAGRQALPSAAILDAQAVKAADTVSARSRGYDAAKRINGRKRHLAVDSEGLLLGILVSAASLQDRDGGLVLLQVVAQRLGSLRLVWADAGYRNRLMEATAALLGLGLRIVSKRAGQEGFSVLPRRWVVERTFAWLMKSRRLSRDYERRTDHAEAMVKWAMVGLMARRIAPTPRQHLRPSQHLLDAA